ncbi:YcgL domain-containing protein, partial [Pseudomonas aeruginosa]|uniref:YcgL domain-containing protein n=1 Tax=Pseudomonas aeruginosa TaxID=287 RepID=UPI00396833E5
RCAGYRRRAGRWWCWCRRQLAREDVAKVLENIEKQGFHLQMPPGEEEYIEHLPEELLRMNDPL